MYVQGKKVTGHPAHQQNGGWTPWGPGAFRSSAARSIDDLKQEIDVLIQQHGDDVGFPELSKKEMEARLARGAQGNPHAVGKNVDEDAWLEHAERYGEFVGWPEGWNAFKFFDRRRRYDENDSGGAFSNARDAINDALAQINAMFQRLSKFATPEQLLSLRQKIFEGGNLNPSQLEGNESIPESQRGTWLATLLIGLQTRTKDMYKDVVDDFRGGDEWGVIKDMLSAAKEAFNEHVQEMSIDLNAEPDDWRDEASLELAKESYSIMFRAYRSLSPEEAREVEAYIQEMQDRLHNDETFEWEEPLPETEGPSSPSPSLPRPREMPTDLPDELKPRDSPSRNRHRR